MKHKITTLGLIGALWACGAQAEITLNGFANIVGGQTTSSDETLYGFDDEFEFKNGSLVALQASSDLGEGFGVTAQIMSRGENDWEPNFEWAYVSYDASDELRLLFGRQRAPFYMYSDFLDVSYTYAWITPPEGIYSSPFTSFDGIGAIYSTSFGTFDTTFHGIYGGNDEAIGAGGNIESDFRNLLGGSITVNREWLTLRTGYFQFETDIDINFGLDVPWNAAGFPEVADHFVIEDDMGDFIEFGFQADFENLLIVGEYARLDISKTPFAIQDSYFIMAGYRFDEIMIHATYGIEDDSKDIFTGSVPRGVSPELDGLIAGTDGFTRSLKRDRNYYTLGLRWDLHSSAAFKLEFTNFADDLNDANDASLIRTALVLVF